MPLGKSEIILLAPTPGEYAGVKTALDGEEFSSFSLTVLESGPGKINAAAVCARELSLRRKAEIPVIVVGFGTSGSLSASVKGGDIVASAEALVSDWRHEDGSEVLVGPYGVFDYGPPEPGRIERMVIREDDPVILGFIEKLTRNGFLGGRILTSDSFVSGKDFKLSLGKTFQAAVCDMESAAFARTAALFRARFFNLRVGADTRDETLSDYFQKELDVTSVLGAGALRALKILDAHLAESHFAAR